MENIEIYLKGAALYGVPITGIFPTVDLYENRNLGAVIAGLQSLGSEVRFLHLHLCWAWISLTLAIKHFFIIHEFYHLKHEFKFSHYICKILKQLK